MQQRGVRLRTARSVVARTKERVRRAPVALPPMPTPDPAARVRLLIGPANFAGQADAWARAAERELPGVDATSMAVAREDFGFPCDYLVTPWTYRRLVWQQQQRLLLTRSYTHVVIEAMKPVLGVVHVEDVRRDARILRRAGLEVALLAHGSDIRDGDLHKAGCEWSPWHDTGWAEGPLLTAKARRQREVFNGYDGPRFVSTPDLLDMAPGAVWLPTVVDLATWESSTPVLRRRKPVVLHVPSNAQLKGSALIDPVLQSLHDAGRIEYRRLQGLASDEVPSVVAGADLVVDQVALGSYGVMAVQAMAAGRLVLAHVHDDVRARLPMPLPVVEITPRSLEAVLTDVLADRDRYRALAADGPAFARDVHDGRMAAEVLREFLT